jgi:hypothetical protein
MDRGTKQIVRCHFPISHPLAPLRGRTRLIEISLIDAKPFSVSPVLEDDLLVGTKSKRVTDPATLTADQEMLIAEGANA